MRQIVAAMLLGTANGVVLAFFELDIACMISGAIVGVAVIVGGYVK